MEGNHMDYKKDTNANASKRKFLKTAGKFVVYTPPALLLMNKPSQANFEKTGGFCEIYPDQCDID